MYSYTDVHLWRISHTVGLQFGLIIIKEKFNISLIAISVYYCVVIKIPGHSTCKLVEYTKHAF